MVPTPDNMENKQCGICMSPNDLTCDNVKNSEIIKHSCPTKSVPLNEEKHRYDVNSVGRCKTCAEYENKETPNFAKEFPESMLVNKMKDYTAEIENKETHITTCEHNFEFGVFKQKYTNPSTTIGNEITIQEDIVVICSKCGECRLKEIK